MPDKIAILAFGSLLSDPGDELKSLIVEEHKVQTPFRLEFARSSRTRAGAPTLVPVYCEGIGASVTARLLVLSSKISEEEATNMLYRREIHEVGSRKCYDDAKARRYKNGVRVERLEGFAEMDVVLYASLPMNLEWICDSSLDLQCKAERLADMAIKSVTPDTFLDKKDGIRYLEQAIANNIITPLTEPYSEAVLHKTGAATLAEAREIALQLQNEKKT